jgi:heterotetrameric sarcosine oxidase gamma subunit
VCGPSRVKSSPGIAVRLHGAEIIEVAALRSGATAAQRFGTGCGEPLPAFGRVTLGSHQLALSVRPARWLLVDPDASDVPSARAARWRAGCTASAVVTELSSALCAFTVTGIQAREMLARGCRLDLDPQVFPPGSAAATVMAQVPVILAALPHAMLLLTPASTAAHFGEWLDATARPFGRMQVIEMEKLFSGKTVERYL